MLVEHRVDDVDERVITVEQPVPSGQQLPFASVTWRDVAALNISLRYRLYQRGCPGDVAVLLSVGLCSLTLQRDDTSIPALIGGACSGTALRQ